MTETIYFQWQNDVLLRTIYPLREMKLRDFLVFFQEIDLWTAYKDKALAEIEDDILIYREEQAQRIAEAVSAYTSLRDYFLSEQVEPEYRKKFAQVSPEEIVTIGNMHRTFRIYFPRLGDVRKEKYFIAQQVYGWEAHRKEIQQRVVQRQRRYSNMQANHPGRAALQTEIELLKTVTQPMVEEELSRLYAFLSSYNKIENQKKELSKSKQNALARQKELTLKLQQIRPRITPLETRYKELENELGRLKDRPDLGKLEKYFSDPDISDLVQTQFPLASRALLDTLKGLHRDLSQALHFTKEISGKAGGVQNQIYKLKAYRRTVEMQITQAETKLRSMPAAWTHRGEQEALLVNLRTVSLPVIDLELDHLQDFQAGLLASQRTEAQLDQMLAAKEQEKAGLVSSLEGLTRQAREWQEELLAIQALLDADEDQNLARAVSTRPVTVRDIVAGKIESYKAALSQMTHRELMEEVCGRFLQQPERYPLWLQYMVIHFSGMRYQSAHGSWADPKDLLVNLRMSALEREFKTLDDAAIDDLCLEKITTYEPVNEQAATLLPGLVRKSPKLAHATDAKSRDKIRHHLRGLKSPTLYQRRKALFDLLLDEESYEVEMMTGLEARDALESIKDELPDWMWKEIVKLTDLRLSEVHDSNWENLTDEEQEERNAPQWEQYRLIMNKWKQDHLTGWREEHDRTNRLIVTRAVCNETAEHIQHLRGHSPPGGLTAKPAWYLAREREFERKTNPLPNEPQPYFVKPTQLKDFTAGASILWLRFVRDYPNPWRIAVPLKLNNGDDLLPRALFAVRPASPGVWDYDEGNAIKRTRTVMNGKQMTREEQWLRWMHEATVVTTGESFEGPVILTFETALPYEDKRLATIGVFKHTLGSLRHLISGDTFNGTYVGFVPEAQLPVDDLAFMLDWNKILLRQVMSPADLEAHQRKYIYKS